MRAIGALLLFSATVFAQPSMLPLQEGNFWTYQQRNGVGSFTIRVGTPALIGGNTYYRLTGYVTEPLWVRFGNYGALYYRDEDKDQEFPLTIFERSTSGAFFAHFRVCESYGQAQLGDGSYRGPSGSFGSTLVIRYTNFGCADAGVEQEQYAANIGMVERVEQSFTGPRAYDLVAARIGGNNIQTGTGTSFGVTLRKPETGLGLLAILDLKATGPDPVRLRYLSSQQYDAIVRDDQGNAVWQWSEGRIFLPVILDELSRGRSWSVPIPLTDRTGASLPAGKYSIEAWIASGHDKPQFAATAPFQIAEKTE